jgi:hypothetical protein
MGSREGEDAEAVRQSSVDGPYFKNTQRLLNNLKANPVTSVQRKVTRGNVTYYQRANGVWEHADFGTTCTCCMIMNAPDNSRTNRKVPVCMYACVCFVHILCDCECAGRMCACKCLNAV